MGSPFSSEEIRLQARKLVLSKHSLMNVIHLQVESNKKHDEVVAQVDHAIS